MLFADYDIRHCCYISLSRCLGAILGPNVQHAFMMLWSHYILHINEVAPCVPPGETGSVDTLTEDLSVCPRIFQSSLW